MSAHTPRWHEGALGRSLLASIDALAALPIPVFGPDELNGDYDLKAFADWSQGAPCVGELDSTSRDAQSIFSLSGDMGEILPEAHQALLAYIVVRLIQADTETEEQRDWFARRQWHLELALMHKHMDMINSRGVLPQWLRVPLCLLQVRDAEWPDVASANLDMMRRLRVVKGQDVRTPVETAAPVAECMAHGMAGRLLEPGWRQRAWLTPDVAKAVAECLTALTKMPVPATVRKRWRGNPLVGPFLADATVVGDTHANALRAPAVGAELPRWLGDRELAGVLVAYILVDLLTTEAPDAWKLHALLDTALRMQWEGVSSSPPLMAHLATVLSYLQLLCPPMSDVANANWGLIQRL